MYFAFINTRLVKYELKSNYQKLFRAAKVDSIRRNGQSRFEPRPGVISQRMSLDESFLHRVASLELIRTFFSKHSRQIYPGRSVFYYLC